jgi:hypothetical protein
MNRLPLRKIASSLDEKRPYPLRYAVALIALFVPAAQGCGESVSCLMTATCPLSDAGEETTADATADATHDGGALTHADASADHERYDGQGSAQDSAPDARSLDERSLLDVAADRSDDATLEAGANRDGDEKDATLDGPIDTTISKDTNPFDAGDTGDVADAPADVAPDVPACDASAGRSPLDEPCLIDERYGSFVSPTGSDTSGKGTRAAPFQTIGRGMSAAKSSGARVFVCDNGTGYTDRIVADATTDGLAIYGGFDCKMWVFSAGARARVLPKSGPAITASQLTVGITIENFDLRAADAAPGASSIAAQLNASAGIVFRRSRMAAGKGGAGGDGQDGAAGENALPPGAEQRGLPPVCNGGTPEKQNGGVPAASTCGSDGGQGGIGTLSGTSPSHQGSDGYPKTGVSPVNLSNGGTTCRSDISTPGVADGGRGADGLTGAPGSPAPSGGTFSDTGYTPAAAGGDGTPGNPGQGGGGGVGCPAASMCLGPSGGAGGPGGCGGKNGTGGRAGGASIGLLSWRSTVVLDRCEVVSANGGPGGKGGNGGFGGKGAAGGIGNEGYDGSDPSGAGGWGGEGGPGAAAAGGNGGPTYGIAFVGQRPAQQGTTIAISVGGPGGAGGTTPASPVLTSQRAADGLLGDAAYELAIP